MNCYFMIKIFIELQISPQHAKELSQELEDSEESLLSHIKYIQNLNQTEKIMPVNGFCLSYLVL